MFDKLNNFFTCDILNLYRKDYQLPMVTQREKRRENRRGLTSGDVVKLLYALESEKLSFRRLYYYEKTGLIVPSIKSSRGRGVQRLYSAEDFIVLRWLVLFNKNGIPLSHFRSVVDLLKIKMPEILVSPQEWLLETKGNTVKFVNKLTGRQVEIIDQSAQYNLIFRSPEDPSNSATPSYQKQ